MTSNKHNRNSNAKNKNTRAQNGRQSAANDASESEAPTGASEEAAERAAADMLEALLAFDDPESEENLDEISSALEALLAPDPPAISENDSSKSDSSKSDGADSVLNRDETTDAKVSQSSPDVDKTKDRTEPKTEPGKELVPVPAPGPLAILPQSNLPVKRKQKQKLPRKAEQTPPTRAQSDLDRVLRVGPKASRARGSWFRRIFWLLVLVALIFGFTRPYSMEVGGEFIIQPLDRAEVRARTDGEIIQIDAEEGDWVQANEILAVLSNWDEKRDVAVRQADVSRLEAELETLMEGPKASEIAVAQQRLATAIIQVEIAEVDLQRQEQLLKSGTISAARAEDARSKHRLAKAEVAEQQSSLELVSEPPTDLEITSAKAEISRSLEDLEFAKLKLEQANIRATVSGQIVSTMIEVPIGTYLPEGGLFVELEDNRTVVAMIEVPETSIEDVKIGASVEMRLWSDTSTSVYGTVKRLAPRAEEREFGRVVRVNVEVPNPDGKLNGNTTGQAKINAGVFPAWVVFTRLIVRFFDVEVWSWLP